MMLSQSARRCLATHVHRPQTLTEKIVQRFAVNPQGSVHSGDFVSISPEHVMTHDNTAAVMTKFQSIGASKFKNPRQPVFTLDHDVQNRTPKNLAKYANIEAFARHHNVDFYPAGRGIGHQILIEEGYAFPQSMTVASDSHSNMYGGIGCLGTPVVRTDAAALWATGRTWWQIPPMARVQLLNTLPPGATGKDVIIALCGLVNQDQVLNHALEFVGSIKSLSFDERLTIANMTTEWGALSGLFPVDDVTLDWLWKRVNRFERLYGRPHPRLTPKRLEKLEANLLEADSDAYFAKTITLDLATVEPHASGPNSVKIATPLSTLESQNIAIQKAYLLSCVNSRVSDLNEAAKIMKGKTIAPGVEFYIAPASSEVQAESQARGDWDALLAAGAIPLPAGCGPCIGLGKGLLKDGEVGISATNRNFKGRMGSPAAQAYLASPAVVAASALAGKIISPQTLLKPSVIKSTASPVSWTVQEAPTKPKTTTEAELLPGFPATFQGRALFCDANNLNTDGIYPGKYTYQDDLTPEKMAQVVMENYDPDFAKHVQQDDILVGGFNFGTGSSREQAATALLYAGIRLVIAGSFSETFKRNALNNGLVALECPELVRALRSSPSSEAKTQYLDKTIVVKTVQGVLEVVDSQGQVVATYGVPVLGAAAQELVKEGGLENWVKARLEA